MFAISSREKKMVVLMILFVSGILFYRYFLVPFIDEWKSTTAQIQVMQTRITRAQQLKANPSLALYAQETIQSQTSAIASLLENMESWSADAGVTMTSVRPGPVQSRGSNSELNYDIEVTGELGKVCRFIDAIEQPNVIARINKIRIAKPKDILPDLTVVVTVSTLSLSESTPVKKATTAGATNEL